MVFPDQMRGKHVVMVFPGIVSAGISFPLHQVLEITAFSKVAMIDDGLDFEFFFSINDVWGRSREVVPVLVGLFERRQESGMKDVMDGPGRR